jgi:polyamine oxidase
VLAVPIGVLKSKRIQFVPNLPDWKYEAINSLGFGNVCKILIDFSDQNKIKSNKQYIGITTDDVNKRGLATFYLNLKALANIPALMTFGLGDNAD